MAPRDHRQLLWGESETAELESVGELEQRLAVLTEEAMARPFMAELIAINGNSLSMGLGREETVLSWVAASNDPPYYASKGNPKAEGTIAFYYSGDWSEFPRWSAVPVPAGLATMREFFQTGKRPSTVEWEEV